MAAVFHWHGGRRHFLQYAPGLSLLFGQARYRCPICTRHYPR